MIFLKNIFRFLFYNYLYLKNNLNFLRRIAFHIIKPKKKNLFVKEVIFIQTHPASWNSVKPVFDKLSNNESFDVKVLVIPTKEMLNNEIALDEYYQKYTKMISVNFLIFSFNFSNKTWYDLKTKPPYYIFFNRPYDSELPNSKYRSRNLTIYSKICFLHYGYSLSNNYSKFWKNESFIYNTDLIFAENSTKYYEYTKSLAPQIILGLTNVFDIGYPRFELIKRSTIKSKKDEYTTILWTPRWTFNENSIDKSSFLDYVNLFIDYFKINLNYKLICRPHPLMFSNLLQKNIIDIKEYNSIIESFNKTKNISFDFSPDYINSINESDIIISDYSALIADFFVSNKPLIYLGKDTHFNREAELMAKTFYKAKSFDEIKSYIGQIIKDGDLKKKLRSKHIDGLIFRNNFASSDAIIDILKNG